MSPEPPPDAIPPPEPATPEPSASEPPSPQRAETYPFWGYLDLAAFVLIALLGAFLEALLLSPLIKNPHIRLVYVELPAQFILYAFLLWMLSVIFRRYYGRPFWQSVRWTSPGVSYSVLVGYGIGLAFAVMIASVLLKTPDTDSPMKELLSDKGSALLLALFGTTLGPICEEILFRGFLQPLLVRSLGPALGILLAALPFGLLHLAQYGNSWRHVLLITLAGAAFGWVRHRTGSTKAAAVMHAAYNLVFFMLLALQRIVPQKF